MNYYSSKKQTSLGWKVAFGIGVLIVLIIAWIFYSNYQTYQAQAKVNITVEFDKIKCSNPAYPLLITVANHSAKTITQVAFYIGVYFPGHSNNLATADKYVSYKIIAPNETAATCYELPKLDLTSLSKMSVPTDNSAYEYKIMKQLVSFKQGASQ